MIEHIKAVKWSLLAAMAMGFLLSNAALDLAHTAYQDAYDRLSPVVIMEGKVVSVEHDSVILHVYGKKLRDCEFLSLQAYAKVNGISRDLMLARLGKPEDGSSKPPGHYDLGNWRLWPANSNDDEVSIYVTHSCAKGRKIRTLIASAFI